MLRFFEENSISLQLSDLEILECIPSEKNGRIELFTHRLLGKILVINNEIQHIQAWAPLYHESIVHIPASFISKIETVLILGGGSLFAAQEVLKYNSVKHLVMVDHDSRVIEIMHKHYQHTYSVLTNPSFDLKIESIETFFEKNTEKFDLIINDAVDILFQNENMLNQLTASLKEGGLCSDVVYRSIYEPNHCMKTINRLKAYNTAYSLIQIPEYPGIMHLLTMFSPTLRLSNNTEQIKNKIQLQWLIENNPCMLYHPRFIRYYLFLPPYLAQWVKTTP